MLKLVRIFIGVTLSEEINAKIQQWINTQWQGSPIRFIKKENRHITIKFLGNVNQGSLPKISEALGEAVSKLNRNSSEIAVEKLGFFPNEKNPHVFWIGLKDSSGYLADIFNVVENELRELGFSRDERSFHAHITLARLKKRLDDNDRTSIDSCKDIKFGEYTPSKLVLFESILKGKGAVYDKISEFDI